MCSWWSHEKWWWSFWKSNILSFWFWWGIGYVPSLDDAIQSAKIHDILKSMIISMEIFHKKKLIRRLMLMKAHTMEWTWIIKNTMMQCWRILKWEWVFLTSYFWTCWIRMYNKRCSIYNYNSKFHGSMFGEWFNSFSSNLWMWSIF